jgi:hypothetical protein
MRAFGPTEAPLLFALDDPIERRRGEKSAATGIDRSRGQAHLGLPVLAVLAPSDRRGCR